MKSYINEHTLSLCQHCHRHIPASTFVELGSVWITKTCPEHGTETHLVERDAEFYLGYRYPERDLQDFFDAICLDITNRCNLTCPHCYQMPDNFSRDETIDSILDRIRKWPRQTAVVLMGAEPTVRHDLPELIDGINSIAHRPVIILTNGVRLARRDYVEQFCRFDNVYFTIGLNHPDYQGHAVRAKQEQALENLKSLNIPIKNISYTLEGYHQLEYCLEEIQDFNSHKKYCSMYRIRVGTEIGRCPDQDTMFMSELVKKSREIAELKGWTFIPRPEEGIRAHYPVEINGVMVKLIQWPDSKTIDLNETQTESWADMLPDRPISPLVHQVLLRDRLVNNNLPLLDETPVQYIMR
jgi:organic radical activating enzyme